MDELELSGPALLEYMAKVKVWRTRIRDGAVMSHLERPDDWLVGACACAIPSDGRDLSDVPFGEIVLAVLKQAAIEIRHLERTRNQNQINK